MRKRTRLKLLMGAALLALGRLAGDAQAEEAIQAKMTFAPLANPNMVLSKPAAANLRLYSGIVIPTQQPLQFAGEKAEASITLAGTALKFTIANAQDFVLKQGDTSIKLERTEGVMSLRPATLKLSDGRSYCLAFPYSYVYPLRLPGEDKPSVRGVLYHRSGGVQQFSLDGQTFRIYDHNTDGVYKVDDDSIGIGGDDALPVFAPLGKMIATKAGVYRIQKLAEDGSAIELARVADKTGTLTIGFAAADLKAGLAMGSDDASVSFAVDAAKASVVVLPGQYTLQGGLVYSTSLNKLVATIIPGNLATTEAAAGKTQAITLGEPFALSFSVEKQDGQITIASAGLHLNGKAGEEYTNFTWKTEPDISLVAGGKTIPVGKMKFG